jgi:branched-chain amino acid transport system substrate-binding protein
MTMRTSLKLRAVAIALGLVLGANARAQTKYGIASLGDYTGPYTAVFPQMNQGREGVIAWWNKEVGAGLGVQITSKTFDTRYDAAQTASLWPGIKAELSPIAILGLGGPDVAALQQRLPEDGVPMVMGTAAYGFGWRADAWAFNARPTYGHEFAAFLEWMAGKLGRPVRFAMVSSEASPAYADMAKGATAYAKSSKNVQLVEVIYTEIQPADLTLQVKRVTGAGADVILIGTNVAQAVATKRALQALGKKVPIMLSAHNGLPVTGKAIGGLDAMEGDFEVAGMALSVDEESQARKFYDRLQKEYGLKAGWNGFTMIGISQTLLTLRAVELAAKKVGPSKVTGAAVREALLTNKIPTDRLFGTLPDTALSAAANFPVTGSAINVATVKGGKVVSAATSYPVPVIQKW